MTASLMMPHSRYTYVRTSDGEGGFSKSLTLVGVLFGSLDTYANEPVMVVNKKSEVSPEDIIGVQEGDLIGYYEVKSVMQMGAAQHKRLMLSRRDKPIRPVPQGESS